MLCIYDIMRHPLPVFAKGEEAMGTLKDIITACGYYIIVFYKNILDFCA